MVASVFIYSCKNEDLTAPKVSSQSLSLPNQVNSQNTSRKVGKITDKNLDNLHSKVTTFSDILRRMYSDEIVIDEVNEFIFQKYYSDENIVLNDLFSPDKSSISKNLRIKTGQFKFAFDKEAALNANLSKARINGSDLQDYLVENGVSIYFPYSDNFKGKKLKEITIVMPPKEDTNEAEGIKLSKCGNTVCEEKVRVNDAYAMKNPTHIIYAGGANIREGYSNLVKKGRVKTANTVYVGAIRCSKQYDALISFTGNGGGSEIKVFRGTGYLLQSPNNQIQSINGDIVSVNFLRSTISGCNAQTINAIWDLDWKTDNFEQVFGIYEEDTQGTKTFTGSLSTTVKNTAGNTLTGTVGYNISVQTQDEVIRNWKISRSSFYASNPNNQGYGVFTQVGGLVGGPWAAWDGAVGIGNCTGANVSYVLPTITQ